MDDSVSTSMNGNANANVNVNAMRLNANVNLNATANANADMNLNEACRLVRTIALEFKLIMIKYVIFTNFSDRKKIDGNRRNSTGN